ncbi:hypothetical protein Q8A73_012819 [Channa argus]|nr:hypothetical protein Q8A73_012819 [Channa argus]
MSANSSSYVGVLFFPPPLLYNCLESRVGNLIFAAFTGTSILFLLPLHVFILYLGHKRWQQHGLAPANPCDFITYHMVVMDIIDVLASVFYCAGVYAGLLSMTMVAANVFFTVLCGQMFCLNIICIECYLAVIHPITYLHMRNGPWARLPFNQSFHAPRARGREWGQGEG